MDKAKSPICSTGLALLLSIIVGACSENSENGSEPNAANGVGGERSMGGNGAVGGAMAAGGSTVVTGGSRANSGMIAAGGLSITGANGGAPLGISGSANGVNASAGAKTSAAGSTAGMGSVDTKGGAGGTGGIGTNGNGGAKANSGTTAKGGASGTGGTIANGTGGAKATGGASVKGGSGGTIANGIGGTKAIGGANVKGGSGGVSATGGVNANGGTMATAGAAATWPNIRVIDNHLCDRWGKPFAVRSIESMFGNGSSNAAAFVAGHRALGANALGPLPNSSVSSATAIDGLLAAAYAAGLVVGLNADHTNQGEKFFQNAQIQAIVNRYPHVFLQEAVELGSDMTENQWVQAAKDKVDAYVHLYPDKPLKIGSPDGGRSPRFALDRCSEIVDYYYAQGGRGGLIFTCQLYWKASSANWSYQEENGFVDGLPGILAAIDAMTDSPCTFMPGLDHQDDVGYTGWREVMDHVRASNADAGRRLSFQWWVYYNSGDSYANDLTTNANDAILGITSTGRDVKAKLELDRTYVELGDMNP